MNERGHLEKTKWDLVVVDEAHKMSATIFGSDIKRTKRYQLGQLLGRVTRHLLLLTATPHNGKEEDFQLFLALLDQDRFESRFRGGVQKVDATDVMRHLVKENSTSLMAGHSSLNGWPLRSITALRSGKLALSRSHGLCTPGV